MEKNSSNFIPSSLDSEINILNNNNLEYSRIFNTLFVQNRLRKIESNENGKFSKENNENIISNKENFSFIFPNCNKDNILEILKDFQNKTFIKVKEKSENSYTNEITNKNIDSSNFSNTNSFNKNVENNLFEKINKTNKIDENCDYYNIDININQKPSFLQKLKDKFFNSKKNFDILRYIHLLNQTKTKDLNNFNTHQIQSNNYEIGDEGINFKEIKSNKSIKPKDDKIQDFSLLFFKFFNQTKKNYSFFNLGFYNDSITCKSEEEFVFIISILNINKNNFVDINTLVKENTRYNDKNKYNYINDLYDENNNKIYNSYVKIDFTILTKYQIEQIEKNPNENINYFEENLKINLFKEILDYFKNFIFSKLQTKNLSIPVTVEEENLMKYLYSLESQSKNFGNLSDGLLNKLLRNDSVRLNKKSSDTNLNGNNNEKINVITGKISNFNYYEDEASDINLLNELGI